MSDNAEVVDETVDTDTTPDVAGNQTGSSEDKTFTQQDIDNIISRTIARERSKFEKQLEETKSAKDEESLSEVQKLQKQLEELQQENASAKLTALRSKIASETGVPTALLTAEAEEDLKAQAEAIKEYAKSQTPDTRSNTSTPKENLKGGNVSDSKELSRDEILDRVLKRNR